MSQIVVFNRNNITHSQNNRLRYEFPRDEEFTDDSTVALTHLNVYYSWFNITKKNNNNFFQYRFWNNPENEEDEPELVTFDVTIKDGYYSIQTLYEYFQKVLVDRGHFLETIDNQYVYFFELLTNETYYSIQWNISSVSTQMDFGSGLESYTNYCKVPTSWKNPSNFQTPELIIPTNNKFGELLGFNEGTIQISSIDTEINDTYTVLNDKIPEMEPSSSYIVTCSLIHNSFAIPDNVLYAFTIPNGVSFGSRIQSQTDIVFSKIRAGNYKYIDLYIYDQDFNPLQMKDSNMLVTLAVKK